MSEQPEPSAEDYAAARKLLNQGSGPTDDDIAELCASVRAEGRREALEAANVEGIERHRLNLMFRIAAADARLREVEAKETALLKAVEELKRTLAEVERERDEALQYAQAVVRSWSDAKAERDSWEDQAETAEALYRQEARLRQEESRERRSAEAKLAAAIKDADETTAILAAKNGELLKELRAAEAQVREYRAALEQAVDCLSDEDVPDSALCVGDPLLRWKALLARTAEGVD